MDLDSHGSPMCYRFGSGQGEYWNKIISKLNLALQNKSHNLYSNTNNYLCKE